jgi:hypothetical protein
MNVRKINVRSFDFDGCIFNKNYIDSVTQNYSVVRGDDVFEVQLIEHNKNLIDDMQQNINAEGFTEVITMVGSNRQSYKTDRKNMVYDGGEDNKRYKGSCFPALVSLTKELNRQTKDVCRYDGYLLADTYGNLEHGSSFAKAMYDDAIDPEMDGYSYWLFDESKFTIFYAQMHKIASEHPEAEIFFDVYDDNEKILAALNRRFKNAADLIPANLKLRLHGYAGNVISDYGMIEGRGEIDYNFENNIHLMLEMSGLRFPQDTNDEHNILQKLFENGILNFINAREMKKDIKPSPIVLPVKKPSLVRELEPVRERIVELPSNHSFSYRYRWLIAAGLILLVSLILAGLIVSLAFVPVAPVFTFAFGIGLALKVTASSALGAGLAALGASIAAGATALGLSAFAVWDRGINKKDKVVRLIAILPAEKDSPRPLEGLLSGSTGSILNELDIELGEIPTPEFVIPPQPVIPSEPIEIVQPELIEEELVTEPDAKSGDETQHEKKSSSDELSRSQPAEDEAGHSLKKNGKKEKNGKKDKEKNGKKDKHGKNEGFFAGNITQFPAEEESHERKGLERTGTINRLREAGGGFVKRVAHKIDGDAARQSKERIASSLRRKSGT